jgi:SAM-dependent methyltransferase
MTRYCVVFDRHELIAAWGTGEGDLAASAAVLPSGAGTIGLLSLARALTQFSGAAWRTYTHPASAAGSLEANSEGWRREQERKHFSEVADAITRPNLPSGGSMAVSYSSLLESAHRVGRALHRLDDPQLVKAVAAEAAAELAAVESAELGDLSGRAQQAVLLSREDASPVQVAASNHLLQGDPFGPAELFVGVDPTAAAVAAAHWLAAAADVAAEAAGLNPTEVVLEADNIEALPHETPTLVLDLIGQGASPHQAVTGLVRHAMHVADGLLPDAAALREQLDDLEGTLAQYSGTTEADLTRMPLRLTPLDPQRPARDLLEDLLTGIHGCWLLYDEYEGLEHDGESGTDDVEEWDDEQTEQHQNRSREHFARLVRDTAARDRLI